MRTVLIIQGQKNTDDIRIIRDESWNERFKPKHQWRGEIETHYEDDWVGFVVVETWEIPWEADSSIRTGAQDFKLFTNVEDARQFLRQLGSEQIAA